MTQQDTHKTNLLSAMSGGFWKPVGIAFGVVVIVVLLFGSGLYAWAQTYEGRVLPNVSVGQIELDGLDYDDARLRIQTKVDEIITNGILVELQNEEKTLSLVTLVGTDLIEEIEFDIDALVEELLKMHGTSAPTQTRTTLASLFADTDLQVAVTMQEDRIVDAIRELFPDVETLATDSRFEFVFSTAGWTAESVEGISGQKFDTESFIQELETNLVQLNSASIELELTDKIPEVSLTEAEAQEDQAIASVSAAPYRTQVDDGGVLATWEVTAEDLLTMLVPGENEEVALDQDAFDEWMIPVIAALNIEAQNARIEIEDGRVVDFQQSEIGQTIDEETLYLDLSVAVSEVNEEPIEIVLILEEPTTAVGDVNDLGITEILGSGTSSYRGSPYNRKLNIQNGVDLLNGRLIAPGETFSLIEALSPFTYENGYYSELVIKGDKIEPEMGGGLCQIGTTTFRATMNAALEVTERRNHSLVVSYYNDPTNGLPGTDATIYEPAPDYKFTNNTENYVLFQAENLTDTYELRFTFWGTSDGRQGSYSAPVVSRWISVGDDQEIETEDLEPGEEECQLPHIGADASFTYTVVMPTGEIEETLFESHYRPLPRICLVGIDPDAEEEEENEEEVVEEGFSLPEEE